MATGFTKVSDIFQPETFNRYVIERLTTINAFFASGVVGSVDGLVFNPEGGTIINMPFWKALTERAQLLDDNTDLVVKKIATGNDKAVQHMRALVYGATDLAAALAGSDPMKVIGDGIAANWSQEMNLMLISTLKGAFAALLAESPDVNIYNISGLSGSAAVIDGASFVDAAQMLGDFKGQIAAIAMHSAVEAKLAKADLIATIRDSEGKIILQSFMGKRVIIDDALVAAAGVYTAYLFGPAAVGFAEGTPKVPSEVERNPLINGGQEYLVQRRHFVLHPRGIAWDPNSGVPALETPSDAELEAAGNWARVYSPKNIRIVQFKFKLA